MAERPSRFESGSGHQIGERGGISIRGAAHSVARPTRSAISFSLAERLATKLHQRVPGNGWGAGERELIEMAEEALKAELIYHYCGVEAFMSIMKTRAVWLTDLYQTNDAKEGEEIIDVVRAVLEDEKAETWMIHEWAANFAGHRTFMHGYGFCASEEGDLLSQWRGYAHDGMGFSIGFDRKMLADASQETKVEKIEDLELFMLGKVLYNLDEQKEKVRESASRIPALLREGALNHIRGLGLLGEAMDDDEKKKRREQAFNALMLINMGFAFHLRLTIKNKAFSEEKEWRLFSPKMGTEYADQLKEKVGYIKRTNSIVPYLIYELGKGDLVKEVIVGPRNRTPDYALKMFLRSCGYSNVKIRHSSAPYLPN